MSLCVLFMTSSSQPMTLHVYEDSHSLWIKTFNFTFSILFFRIDVVKTVAYRALLNSFAAHAPQDKLICPGTVCK